MHRISSSKNRSRRCHASRLRQSPALRLPPPTSVVVTLLENAKRRGQTSNHPKYKAPMNSRIICRHDTRFHINKYIPLEPVKTVNLILINCLTVDGFRNNYGGGDDGWLLGRRTDGGWRWSSSATRKLQPVAATWRSSTGGLTRFFDLNLVYFLKKIKLATWNHFSGPIYHTVGKARTLLYRSRQNVTKSGSIYYYIFTFLQWSSLSSLKKILLSLGFVESPCFFLAAAPWQNFFA